MTDHRPVIGTRVRHTAVLLACIVLFSAALATLGSATTPSPVFAGTGGASFEPVGPVRLADTRDADCGCTRLDAHTIRVVVAGRDGIRESLVAAAITLTATGASLAGFVTAYLAGEQAPETSTLNVSPGNDASNSAIVPLGVDGAIDVHSSVDVDVIVDVSGAFVAMTGSNGGRFQSVAPHRLLDTRLDGQVAIGAGRSVTVLLPTDVSVDAVAVAVNVTSVGAVGPGYLTGFAAGSAEPSTSFANPDGSGRPVAAAVILPVSANGFTIASSVAGDIVVDITGWFTGPSAPSSTEGLFVPIAPTRLVDTRTDPSRLWPGGEREIAVPFGDAAAIVSNMTTTGTDGPGYVTAHPAGTPLPVTSSLNAPARDSTTANMAITTVSDRGIGYFSSAGTDLVVDASGYFLGSRVAATQPVPANVAPLPRVLMIGDSTLGGLVEVRSAQSALRGFVPVLDARPCRRLFFASCTSNFTRVAPNTAADAIQEAVGTFDIVVIKTGYNDYARNFERGLAEVVAAARAKGARHVIWLTYSESTTAGSYDTPNAILRARAGTVAFPDLVVADWRGYAANSDGWYSSDRVHLLVPGVWATADYISRWVAHVSHLPCAVPWMPGGAIGDPCPSPDDFAAGTGMLPALGALYGF